VKLKMGLDPFQFLSILSLTPDITFEGKQV